MVLTKFDILMTNQKTLKLITLNQMITAVLRYLMKKNAVMWNIRFESGHQLKAYGNAALTIKVVFEAVIEIKCSTNLMSTFYVIEHGEQSLIGKDTAIKLGVLKLGIGINHVEKLQSFNKIARIKVNLAIDTTVRPVQ